MPAMSAREIETYREIGVVVPEVRIEDYKIKRLRATLGRLIAANPGIHPERLVGAHIEGENAEGLRGSRDFLDLARDPAILDLAEQLIGPDIILWSCEIFCKLGGEGMPVPWHQDGHYWPIRPLATCTVWVALDGSTAANGCLRVIPGSHRGQRLHEHLREDRTDIVPNQAVKQGGFDPNTAFDVELEPGQMSLHDVFLIHGSNPNRSTKRRAGVALRYMPGTSFMDRDPMKPGVASGHTVDVASRPLWLVRGTDRTGRNDFRIGHRPG